MRLLDAYPDFDDLPEPVKDSQGQIAKTVDQIKGHKDIENFNMFKESVKRVNKGVKNIMNKDCDCT